MKIEDISATIFLGEDKNHNAGRGLALKGDITGDGLADLLIGAPGASENRKEDGKVYLFVDMP